MKVSPSRMNKYLDCERQYYYAYEVGITQELRSAALPFGKSVHSAIEFFLKALSRGEDIDINQVVDVFNREWNKALETEAMQLPAGWSIDDLTDTGRNLAEQFPDYWNRQKLFPVVDSNGDPMIEKKLVGRIAGVECQCISDLIAMNERSEVVVLDWKTPAQQSPEGFEGISDQLTLNTELLRVNQSSLGLDGLPIGGAGYSELLKRKVPKKGGRGTGPIICDPVFAEPRDQEKLVDFYERLKLVADGIANKRYPRRPRMAHNTPCQMCDFREYCINGDTEGLVFPATQQQEVAFV